MEKYKQVVIVTEKIWFPVNKWYGASSSTAVDYMQIDFVKFVKSNSTNVQMEEYNEKW